MGILTLARVGLLWVFVLVSCSSGETYLQGGQNEIKKHLISSEIKNDAGRESSGPETFENEGEETAPEEDVVASPPTVISGAYLALSCGMVPDQGLTFGCQMDAGEGPFPYGGVQGFLIARGQKSVLKLKDSGSQISGPVWAGNFVLEDGSGEDNYNPSDWALILMFTEMNGTRKDYFFSDLISMSFLPVEMDLISQKVIEGSEDRSVYIRMIEDSDERALEQIAQQKEEETVRPAALKKPVMEGYSVYRHTELIEGNLQVIMVYDEQADLSKLTELAFIRSQLLDYAAFSSLPLLAKKMTTVEFLKTNVEKVAMLIWSDLGDGGASVSDALVSKFDAVYRSGVPFVAIGGHLPTYHLNSGLNDGSIELWHNLIRMGKSPDNGGSVNARPINLSSDASSHPILKGPFGDVTGFTFNGPVDHPKTLLGTGGQVLAKDSYNNHVVVTSNLTSSDAPVFAMSVPASGVNETDVTAVMLKNLFSSILMPLLNAMP